jgi:hypothetical protein
MEEQEAGNARSGVRAQPGSGVPSKVVERGVSHVRVTSESREAHESASHVAYRMGMGVRGG